MKFTGSDTKFGNGRPRPSPLAQLMLSGRNTWIAPLGLGEAGWAGAAPRLPRLIGANDDQASPL